MKKEIIIWTILLISITILQIATAKTTQPYTFSTESGSTGQVTVIWYSCQNQGCTVVKSSPTSNLFSPNPTTLSSTSILNVNFPDCPETSYGYFLRFFMQGYRSRKVNPYSYSCWTGSYTYPSNDIDFAKTDNCKSDFTTTVTSCAEAGLPLSILTDTRLDAVTKSAYIPSNDYYFPKDDPQFRPYRELKTRMNVDVKKQSSTASVSGFPQSSEYPIYADETHNFNFLWQTSKNTEPGTYTVKMTSTVPDEKCDQSTMIPVEQAMDVYVARSLDTCRAEIQNFAMATANILLNQPVVFTGKRLNEYQDWSYTSIEACKVENAELTGGTIFDATYTFTITNQSNNKDVYTTQGTFQKAAAYNTFKDFSVSWPSAKGGSYKAKITINSAGSTSVCNNVGITASQTLTFNAGTDNDHDGWYSLEDCNDNNASINPGMPEICNAVDDDCNPNTKEDCTKRPYYKDNDKDGLYSSTPAGECIGQGCNPSGTSTTAGDDCDDNDPAIKGKITFYKDNDNDNYGISATTTMACPQNEPAYYAKESGDCDDGNSNIYPGAAETCNGKDDDCDGSTDEGDICKTVYYYCDDDLDNFYSTTSRFSCKEGSLCQYTGVCRKDYAGTDCNDNDKNVYPNALEICNGKDDNTELSSARPLFQLTPRPDKIV
jgi:hypothetical protein